MRKLVFLFTPFLLMGINPFASHAQSNDTILPYDNDSKLFRYQEVVECPGYKDELYMRAIEWINSYFERPESVTRVRDQVNGKIEGVSRFKIYNREKKGQKFDAGIINYTLIIEFKENRYRYTVTDFNLQSTSYFPLETWLDKNSSYYHDKVPDYFLQVDENIKTLVANMKKGMIPKKVKKDEW